jgi:adenylate cyclase
LGEERVERRLAVILAADVAGYSRLMGADEEGTLRRLNAVRRELIDPKVREHRGRIVKTTGDGMLVEFGSVVDAVRCAVQVQRGIIDREAGQDDARRIRFRIGIHLGDVILEGDDIFGDCVNIAARLEALAEPGGLCISAAVSDQIGDRLGFAFRDMGERSVKNIMRPVRVYDMSAAAVAETPPVALEMIDRGPLKSALQSAEAKAAPRLSVVVLPLANLSADPEEDYFVDAITDDVISGLSRVEGSSVISRTSSFAYKGKAIDVKQIGRDLGVRYVLEGSVRRLGAQVQVNIQLTDGANSVLVWADRFGVERSDLSTALEQIVTRLARSLHLTMLEVAARRIEQEQPVNPDAADFVMRGWAALYRLRTDETLRDAEIHFERALELDPQSVDARIGLATALTEFVGNSRSHVVNGANISPEADLARSEQLLTEAMPRDPNNPKLIFTLGRLRGLQNRLTDSRILFERAIRMDPNSTQAYHLLGITLVRCGEPEAALPFFSRRVELDPLSPNLHMANWWSGYADLLLGRADEAIGFFHKARAAEPRNAIYHMFLAAALGLKGDIEEAKRSLAEALQLSPQINCLAKLLSQHSMKIGTQKYFDLQQQTVVAGLRRVGLPDK